MAMRRPKRREQPSALPPISERRFQRQVVDLAKLLGYRVYWTWNSLHSPKGWPDLVLIKRPRIVFLELKGERTPVTDEQRETITELQACGMTAMIARPSDWDEIERVLGVRTR
jgi:hypothetical protein